MLSSPKFHLFLVLLFSASSLFAEEGTETAAMGESQNPLAIQSGAVLTQAEIDAAFSRIPEEHRLAIVRDGGRVDRMIRVLLQNRLLANEARKAGLDEENLVKIRLELAAEKELAEVWQEHLVAQMPDADYESLAREKYLLDTDKYQSAGTIDVSHILISSESRSEEKAYEIAVELHAELVADPESFDALVIERSEDPSKNANGGRFPSVQTGQMVKPFEDAAFALDQPGQISEPVQTAFGYHIIRLNQKAPSRTLEFDEVKAALIEQEKKAYRAAYTQRYLKNLLAEPIEVPEEAVEELTQRYFGENFDRSLLGQPQ